MMKTLSAVIVAAGNSSRMGRNKQQILLAGKPVWLHSVCTFGALPQTVQVIVVAKEEEHTRMESQLRQAASKEVIAKTSFVAGGASRAESVANGVAACTAESDYYAIHDGARPLITREEIEKALSELEFHRAVSMGVPVKDTIKQVDAFGTVIATPNRESLMITQTPQIFDRALYDRALIYAKEHNLQPTDDCQLIEAIGEPVYMVSGSYQNIKITTPEDIPTAQAMLAAREKAQKEPGHPEHPTAPCIRAGHGYDVHRFAPERALVLGGVTVPYEFGLLGHSDADVLLHAVMDALLGAAALGDIGKHFPDTDPSYEGADSLQLLQRVEQLLIENHFAVSNIDATIVAQKPKLAPYIQKMRENIAAACKIPLSCVSVKATTEESLGFTGRLEGISAHAVCILRAYS